MRDVMQEFLKPEYLERRVGHSDAMTLTVEMADNLGPGISVHLSRVLQRRRGHQKTLRLCKVPALALCGAHDVLCPIKGRGFMPEPIPGATLRVL